MSFSFHFLLSEFCTGMHSFPQLSFPISLAKKMGQVYRHFQIEPGSLKNLTAQLKEGAAAARLLRLRFFWAGDLPALAPVFLAPPSFPYFAVEACFAVRSEPTELHALVAQRWAALLLLL